MTEKVYAGFRIIGTKVVVDEITKRTGIQPTKTHDLKRSRKPGWFLSSHDAVDSPVMVDHIRFLLDQLEPQAEVFDEIYEQFSVVPSIFCFARNPRSVGVSLDSETIQRLAALGLNYDVDVYWHDERSAGYAHITDHRSLLIERLNAALRRRSMYHEGTSMLALRDLAFIDRKERQLAELGDSLARRGWWSKTGVSGALECVFGDGLEASSTIEQAPLVEIARHFEWLEIINVLDPPTYWQAINTAAAWLEEPRTIADLTAWLGEPSIVVGNVKGVRQWTASRGYTTYEPDHWFLWFDSIGPHIVSCRRRGETLLDEFISGRPATFDSRGAAKYLSNRQESGSRPFGYRTTPGPERHEVGTIVRFVIRRHYAWGVAGSISGSPRLGGTVDYHSAGFTNWTSADFPPIGSTVTAVVEEDRGGGALRLNHDPSVVKVALARKARE